MEERGITLHQFSGQSLRLCLEESSGYKFGFATGFLIEKDGKHFLVSNYHVFSGKNAATGNPTSKSGTCPTHVRVFHHKLNAIGDFVERVEPLYDTDKNPLFKFLEPEAGDSYIPDVAVLPLSQSEGIQKNPLSYRSPILQHNDMFPGQSISISIVGFPFGLTSFKNFPIWKAGELAMELHADFQGLPCFLVDSATRGGMSGSPVYAYLDGAIKTTSSQTIYGPRIPQFLGVYSGRLNVPPKALQELQRESLSEIEELGSDLGMVWKWEIIDKILDKK